MHGGCVQINKLLHLCCIASLCLLYITYFISESDYSHINIVATFQYIYEIIILIKLTFYIIYLFIIIFILDSFFSINFGDVFFFSFNIYSAFECNFYFA